MAWARGQSRGCTVDCSGATCDVDDNFVALWRPLALCRGAVQVQSVPGSQPIHQAACHSGRQKVEDAHLHSCKKLSLRAASTSHTALP